MNRFNKDQTFNRSVDRPKKKGTVFTWRNIVTMLIIILIGILLRAL